MEGTVKKINSEKGYGFITPADGGNDLFFHSSGVSGGQFESLHEGNKVTFEKEDSPKGPKAANVQAV